MSGTNGANNLPSVTKHGHGTTVPRWPRPASNIWLGDSVTVLDKVDIATAIELLFRLSQSQNVKRPRKRYAVQCRGVGHGAAHPALWQSIRCLGCTLFCPRRPLAKWTHSPSGENRMSWALLFLVGCSADQKSDGIQALCSIPIGSTKQIKKSAGRAFSNFASWRGPSENIAFTCP